MLEFTRKPLERLTFVFQTGGASPKVTGQYSGVESMMFASIMFGRVKLTAKGKCLVFGEDDNKYLGYIQMVNGLPKKFKPDAGDEDTTFEDWYTTA